MFRNRNCAKTTLLLLLMLCLLAGCSGKGSLMKASKAAYLAADSVGHPETMSYMAVYHFKGTEEINQRAGSTLEEAFILNSDQVPENGYFFYFDGDEDIYVLMDEECNVIAAVNATVAQANLPDTEALSQQYAADCKSGKYTKAELDAKFSKLQAIYDQSLAVIDQCLALMRYSYNVANFPASDKDETNVWHPLSYDFIMDMMDELIADAK